MKMLEKLMERKKQDGKELDPMMKKSKMSMLKSLKDEMSNMMKGDLQGAKVEVAASDEEGLKKGLDKAKELVEAQSDEDIGDFDMKSDQDKVPESDDSEVSGSEPDKDPEAEIKELEDRLAMLKSKKSMM